MTTLPPVWLLDVDGVLNAATKKPDRNVWPTDQWVHGRASDGRREFSILFARPVADFVRRVHDEGRAEIRWHTTWQHEAAAVGKLLGLPDFPVQKAPEFAEPDVGLVDGELVRRPWWKIGAALRVVEDEGRALVWTDDDAVAFSLDRATRYRLTSAKPCLIVAPSSTTGLTPKHLRQIDEFLSKES
jgi:hypothetical protein